MIAFLSGAAAALVLSLVTWFALDSLTVTSIERIENPSVNLEDVDQEYSPETADAVDR